jgi:multiple sugar transport system permease protein
MTAIATPATRPPHRRRLLGQHPLGYLFVAPYVAFLLAIFAYPLGFAVYISFHDYFFAAPGAIVERPFVGLQNYTDALADPVFHRAMLNVVIFLVINVPLTVFVGLLLATALNAAIPFRTFFRASYFIPYVTASVAVIGVWLWLFNSDGLVYILLYLAALQNIPEELYEAAEVDGAGPVKRFTTITVPGVRPTTTLVVIAATITGANFFTEPYLLTGRGGPNGASVSPVLLMYTQGIEQGHAGYAAAIGVLLAIGVIAVSLVNRYLLERS